MRSYDPERAPDSEQWQMLDEQEKWDLVRRHHRRAGVRLPNPTLHSIFHVVIENQLAMGDARVLSTLERLEREGLGRHESIHAIGSVLAESLWTTMREPSSGEPPPETYYLALERLNAKDWLASG